jgi:hypothetical protein
MQIQPVIRQKDALEGRIEQVHCRGALNKCIEQIRWLINIHQSTLSLTYQKRKEKESVTIIRERKKKDILLRLENFRS